MVYPIVRTKDGYAVINPGKPGEKYSAVENMEFQAQLNTALGADDMPDEAVT